MRECVYEECVKQCSREMLEHWIGMGESELYV